MKLKIAADLSLPLDAVTATIVAYGGKGMGKTNLGSVLVEELSRVGLRWAWLDPLGVSWGLRHGAAGTGPGVECLILGGPRLSGSQGAILRKLINVYPRELAKDDLAEAAGQSPTSGGYFNNLGRLRSLGLIGYPTPGKAVALPVLFLDA